MIISVTERGSFKRCRRLWDYGSFNRQGMQPIVPSRALNIGTLLHRALADWTIKSNTPLLSLFMEHSNTEIDRIRSNYSKQVGAPISDEELNPVYEAVQLGMSLAKDYETRWGSPLPPRFRIIRPEQQVIVPIPGTPHELEGTLDGIIADDKNRIYALERKTYDRRPSLEVLNSTDQFLGYQWILTQLNFSDVAGVAYDGIWKRTTGGRTKRELNDLFMRTTIHRNKYALLDFEQNLIKEALDMASNPSIYPNRRWDGCYDCSFISWCDAETNGEDVDYIKQNFFTKRTKDSDYAT